MKVKDPTGRLACWCLMLQKFNFEIVFRRGESNCVLNALSRLPVTSVGEIVSTLVLSISFDLATLKREQKRDRFTSAITEYLQNKKVMALDMKKQVIREISIFLVIEGL